MSGDFNAKQKKKQKIAVIGLSSLMMVAMVVAVTVGIKGTGHGIIVDDDDDGLATSTKAIRSVCHIVEYRHACERTLAHLHTSDPKKLATTTFNAALKNLQGALANSSSITAPKEDRRTTGAIETCKQVMEYAVGDLKRSIDHMSHFDMHKKDEYIENMRIWLSGAITLQETCIDAFENTTGDAGEKMKKLLVSSRELTSNSLDIVAELPSIVKSLSSFDSNHHERKLSQKQEKEKDHAEDELPIWMDFKQRRLLRDPGSKVKADIVVSKDGSSKFKTIMEALKEAPVRDPSKEFAGVNKMFVIYIKEGIYEEQVRVDETKSHIMFIGDGPTKTKITGNNSFADGFVLYKTATVSILGRNFIAKDIGFENSAGPEKHQAVSLLVQSDMSIFYNCRIDGYQDTLYAHSYRQFYRHSIISGSINLILGNAAAVFQNCKFVIRKPLDDQECVIASQGRLHMKEPTGFILQNSTITADPLYYPLRHKNKAYLGQPWKKFSRTIVMQSYLSDSIDSQGWKPWMGTFGQSTCFLSEYENRGPGAKLEGRVKWQGIKNIDPREISGFTPRKFYGGDRWIAPTQVPYLAGLMPT